MTPVGCPPGELVTREKNGDVHIQTSGVKYGDDVCTIAVEEFSCRDPINDAIFCACFQSLDNGWGGERPEVLSIWDTVQEANAQVEAKGTEDIEDQASMNNRDGKGKGDLRVRFAQSTAPAGPWLDIGIGENVCACVCVCPCERD